MSKTSPPLVYPAPIPEEHFAQSGDLTSASALRRCAQAYNFSGHSERKLIACIANGVQSTPAPSGASVSIHFFNFRTGPAVKSVAMLVGMAPASTTTTAPAACVLVLKPSGSTLTSSKVFHPKVAAGSYNPSDIVWSWVELTVDDGLVAGTEYRGYIQQQKYCRIHCAMVYEIAEPVLDSSVTGIADPLLYEVGKPAYSQQLLAQTGTELWRHNGSQLLSWSRADETGIVASTATWANVLETSSSSWSSTTPGYHLQTQYHDTQKGDIPVTLGVYATRTSGSGNLHVKLEQAGGSLIYEPTITGASSPFHSGAFTIAAAAAEKTDVLVRSADAFTVWRVDAINLWEYET